MPDYEFYEHYEREQITDRISVPDVLTPPCRKSQNTSGLFNCYT